MRWEGVLLIYTIMTINYDKEEDPGMVQMTSHARGGTATVICTNCINSLPPEIWDIFRFGLAGRRSSPSGWLCSSQQRGMLSQIRARPHT